MKTLSVVPLKIAAKLYGQLTTFRNTLYDQALIPTYTASLPIISIGNLSAGGNAKTPLCITLAEALQERGYQPVVLSRGYGGTFRGPHLVTHADLPAEVGDEPYQMATTLTSPVVIARDRVKGSQFIEERKLGSLILLDDGFQHRRLARTLDIVSVNVGTAHAVQEFLKGTLLPLGRFRELRDSALRRADMVIFSERTVHTHHQPLNPELIQILPPGMPHYRSYLEVRDIRSLDGTQVLDAREIVTFCGLANPENFSASLRALGYGIIGEHTFPDHYRFKGSDLKTLADQYPEIPLVCTEKDAVKIQPEWGSRVYVVRVKMKIVSHEAFIKEIIEILARKV